MGVLEIVIASTNMHKIREFREMLKNILNLDILSLNDFSDYVPPEETGSTFEENAILKAVSAAKSLNRYVIADDSGLVVPALKGAPGIFSRRYAGSHATDLENRKKLLSEMKNFVDEERNAYFECCIALASPSGLEKVVKGVCEGTIALQDKGGSGFGYDPIFMKHGYNKSFAELTATTKNQISHRRKSLDKLFSSIESLCATC